MRFSSLAFGLTALFSTMVAAAPIDVSKRLPTPEEFDLLSSVEKRAVYQAWYRATNIIPATDEEKRSLDDKRAVYQAWYRATNIIPATDEEEKRSLNDRAVYQAWYRATNILPSTDEE
ncbi:hypothetical protein CC80DRAFT_594887 [Byssothecium circinans]|uniref:Uncharacterized protein n=1 Tax=Byssothecium circinans TaxID=147558 RepID=A0A6A5TVY9_9PLEO|nr:hypothetical protein CC80DRAFT_594887 [Byssothecium circinans]